MTGFLRGLRKVEAVVAATFLVLMVVLIFLGGVARLMHYPLNWTTDVATCLFAWACFLCADIAWRNDSLMSVDLLVKALPARWRAACVAFNYLVIVIFLLYVAVMGSWLAWISRARSFQGIPEVSYSWVTLSMPVGAVLLLLTTWQKVRAARTQDQPMRLDGEKTPC
jgi:TRAP-type C4-dicarboxylate transport system permease small subunit